MYNEYNSSGYLISAIIKMWTATLFARYKFIGERMWTATLLARYKWAGGIGAIILIVIGVAAIGTGVTLHVRSKK